MEITAPLDHLTGLGAAGLEQFTVHMDEVLAAGTLVQIVDVLGDQGDRTRQETLEASQRIVGRIGMNLGLLQLFAAGVVKRSTSSVSRTYPSGVATSSTLCSSHKPSQARKVLMPDSAEIPAPVRITICLYDCAISYSVYPRTINVTLAQGKSVTIRPWS